MTKRDKPIDWSGIEADYVRGAMGIREMARWYGVTDTAIRKKAKQAGWERQAQPGHVDREPVASQKQAASDPVMTSPEGKAKELAGRMLSELDAVTSLHEELEDMICAEESDPRRRQALLKSISLAERANVLKNLSLTMKTLNEAAAPDGKKAQRQANADKSASAGRFAAPSAPKLIVNNR